MSNWYVGQKVVCVNAYDNLVNGRIYTICGIDACCLEWLSFDECTADGGGFDDCPMCGVPAKNVGKSDWYVSSHFRPLDPLEEQIERIESEGCPEPELQEA